MADEPRLNVYLGAERRARMNAFPGTNWSAIAQAAFDRVLETEERLMMKTDEIEAGVARLRAELEELETAAKAEGRAIGIQWALKAPFAEVRSVAAITAQYADVLMAGYGEDFDFAYAIVEAIEELPACLGDDVSDALCEGFVEGVGEIFDKV